MKNIITIILATFLLTSCLTTKTVYTSSTQFKGKHASFLDPNEEEVLSWYHYMTSKTAKGAYIIRTFFPETQQITSYVTYSDKSTSLKNGVAKKWYDNGFMKSEGSYSNNKRSGAWAFYSFKNGNLRSKGRYVSGEKNGLWAYYNDKKLTKEVNFKAGDREGKFIQYDSLGVITNEGIYKADTMFQQTNPPKTKDKSVEQMPFLSSCKQINDSKKRNACSDKALLQSIFKNIKYPALAREYGVEGRVMVQFNIEKDGSITNIQIRNGICEGIKNECISIIHQLPKWEAGIQNGEKAHVKFNLPIIFRLE